MSARKNASNSGSAVTRRRKRTRRETTVRRKPSCVHRWRLENTKYPIQPEVGQVNMGRTKGRCTLCGKTRHWEAPTPDSVHGIESLIISNVKMESDTLPEGFQIEEEDYDA